MIEVKIEAARQKKRLKELVPELLRAGLSVRRHPQSPDRRAMAAWIEEWVELGRTATRGLPPAPTATQILAADRGRLDRLRDRARLVGARLASPVAAHH